MATIQQNHINHHNQDKIIVLTNITAGYGKKQVLTDVSFEVGQGDIVLLTGSNGSGKSTVLKTVYGLLKPWTPEGTITFEGEDITALPVSDMIRRGIVYMPQKKNVFEEFTVEENLLTSASIYSNAEAKERIQKVYEILPLLADLRKRTPFHLSGGEKQLLAFGNMLVHSPKLILLDEPFAGVDAVNSEVLTNCIADLHKKGITFIIVEHKRVLLESMVNKVIELELGTVKKEI
jgi:branched-chain amino acid transport system ATP-binding protein